MVVLLKLELSRWISLTGLLVRNFKGILGINMTMKKLVIFVPVQTMKTRLLFVPVQQYKHQVRSMARSGVCPQRRPHAQQQLARDLEVERAVMGQRCRPQRFGEVQRCNTLYFL